MNKIEKLIKKLCPNGVEFFTIGEIGTLIRGSGLQKKDFVESGVGCIHYGQIYTYYGTFADKTKTFVSEDCAKKLKKVQTSDLIIATTSETKEGVCKAVAWLGDDEIAVSGEIHVLKHKQNSKYLSYYLQTQMFFNQKRKYITGTKVFRVSGDSLKKIKISIPPLEIQEEIVKILDGFTELEAELEARKKQYKYYRNKLLTFRQTRATSYLEKVVHFMNGKGHEKIIDNNGEYIVVNSKFVSTDGKVKKYVAEQICPISKSDTLMVMSDLPNGKALAKCFYVDKNDKYTLNQRICALSVKDNDELNAKYLFYILNRNRQLLLYDNGVDQTNLRKNDILKIKIPLPTLAEQKCIVLTTI